MDGKIRTDFETWRPFVGKKSCLQTEKSMDFSKIYLTGARHHDSIQSFVPAIDPIEIPS